MFRLVRVAGVEEIVGLWSWPSLVVAGGMGMLLGSRIATSRGCSRGRVRRRAAWSSGRLAGWSGRVCGGGLRTG